MPEKPLLLSAGKRTPFASAQRSLKLLSARLASLEAGLVALLPASGEARLRLLAACVGTFVVLVGAADVTSRLAHAVLGSQGASLAFAPAIALEDPSILGAAASASTTEMVPTRLRIPSIGVDASVEQVSMKADGTMDTPKKFGDVAWYAPGGKPGGAGNAVFAGHVDNALTTAGVFEHLSQVAIGDYITVSDAAGKTRIYKVQSVQSYPVDEAPAASIFATSGTSQVVLITCTGQWVPGERQFNERLVVIAVPA